MTDQTPMTCEALVVRWIGNPDEPERGAEPCGKPARWHVRAKVSGLWRRYPGVAIPVCNRHAGWWRKQKGLGGLFDAIVEPLPENSDD